MFSFLTVHFRAGGPSDPPCTPSKARSITVCATARSCARGWTLTVPRIQSSPTLGVIAMATPSASRPAITPWEGSYSWVRIGADERGARPSNNAPDNLQLAVPNPDGSPARDYHGWPDQYGFLSTSQAVFNPIGGPGDDLCVPDPKNLPSTCTRASLAKILSEDVPIKPVRHPPHRK